MPRPPPLTPPPQGCCYFAVERQCFEIRKMAKSDYKCTLARVSRGNKGATRQSFALPPSIFSQISSTAMLYTTPKRPSVKSK